MSDPIQLESAHIDQHADLVNELFGPIPRKGGPQEITLPFTVRAVRTEADLVKALRLRSDCYSRHFGSTLVLSADPDPEDLDPGSTIFLAEDKKTGDAIGCLRFMTNRYSDLGIQKHVDLPPALKSTSLADIRRLAVTAGARGRLVKGALFKAVYLCAVALQIRYLVIGARAPLIRDYEGLFFQDIVPGGLEVELLGLPHRILCLDVNRVPADWEKNGIRWLKPILVDYHPDIEVFSALLPRWVRSRQNDSGSLAAGAHGRSSLHRHLASPRGQAIVPDLSDQP